MAGLRSSPARPRRRASLLVVATGLLLLAGCGDTGSDAGGADGGAGGSSASTRTHADRVREYDVAADAQATPTEIIDAGGPARVAVSDGRRLVAWHVESDDDEGPQQAAWRLYDADGAWVAEGTLGTVSEKTAIPALTAVPDGFLLENYTGHVLRHIAFDGTVTDVPASPQRRATRAGDVLQENLDFQRATFYRPADRTTYRLPRLPFRSPQSTVLDERGRLWVLVDRGGKAAGGAADVASSPGGSGPWVHTPVPLSPGGGASELAVAAGQVLVPTVTGDPENPDVAAVWRRPVDGDPAAAWTKVPTTGVKFEETLLPRADALPDGRVVVTAVTSELWIQGTDGAFALTPPPSGTTGLAIRAGDRFYFCGADQRLYEGDGSGSWRVVPR